ncbi:MAG TPA: gluconate 2-dehydrogenase subunit 3 family protein [Steroidobacteraceae bacterium]
MSKRSSDSSPPHSRREFLTRVSAGAVCLLTVVVDGCERKMTPAQARASAAPFRALDAEAVRTLEALEETLLPGSVLAGVAHYIDHQLAADPADSLLMIKYLSINPPYVDFYRAGLAAARAASLRKFGESPAELGVQRCTSLLEQMAAGELDGWSGPPAPLVYFVLRSDAVDALYGTPSGFEKLQIPYMPHIMPPKSSGWEPL